MVNLDIIKESLGFEKILNENSLDIPFREEYLIPDTQPDVHEVLSVDTNVFVLNREVQSDRVLLEYEVECNVMYLAREEEGLGVNSVVYKEKNSSFIDIAGAEHSMMCDMECNLEHIDANIINERKIRVEGKLKTKYRVYKEEKIDVVKELDGLGDLQIKRKPESIEKNITNMVCSMNGQLPINIGMDKPQIGKIIKCGYMLHRQEVKLGEDKVQVSCLAKINILYRAYDSREVVALEEDLYLSKEEEVVGVNADMNCNGYFEIKDHDARISQNDLGESRVIDVNLAVDANVRVSKLELTETVEDLYSPTRNIMPLKGNCKVNMSVSENSNDSTIRGNINLLKDGGDATQVIDCTGNIVGMESYFADSRVVIKGNLAIKAIYKTTDEEKGLNKVCGEIPFEFALDMPNSQSGMTFDTKANIEDLLCSIEGNSIAVKANIYFYAKCSDMFDKEYVRDVEQNDDKVEKRASVTIYIIQKGDTLWSLAKKYRTTIDDLVKLNNIENPDVIYAGEKIMIPGRAIL
ncbi:DUF3794 and LysM peptidoglycan-binding domain-containing protein [Clostridium sp. LIBA-8841]|uniref:DUF3794 and LysM peptidoglycan-binding domain-containing protein n=1 Tax=Clostridium sp. LIBA-8841 TaxID=2987530 RepID=UPI002AC743B9|nr:SPOCS domain-containing protein [Clostridium sp. LIBA-8841]MDZ5253164.1 DUF3794 domain-containing protein [Clostridium sp. LIBA-8841]